MTKITNCIKANYRSRRNRRKQRGEDDERWSVESRVGKRGEWMKRGRKEGREGWIVEGRCLHGDRVGGGEEEVRENRKWLNEGEKEKRWEKVREGSDKCNWTRLYIAAIRVYYAWTQTCSFLNDLTGERLHQGLSNTPLKSPRTIFKCMKWATTRNSRFMIRIPWQT